MADRPRREDGPPGDRRPARGSGDRAQHRTDDTARQPGPEQSGQAPGPRRGKGGPGGGDTKSSGRFGKFGKPAGKAGRAGPRAPGAEPWRGQGTRLGGGPPQDRPPGRGFDRAIPDGPGQDANAPRPNGDRPPGARPWRAADGRQGRSGGGPPRRFEPDHRPGPRPSYRGGQPSDRPPNRFGPPDRQGPPSRFGPPNRQGPPPGQRPWQSGPPAPRWEDPRAALPAPDLLGTDEELVAGRRPVEEVFAAGRSARRLLVVPQRRNALEQLVLHATRLRIPIVEVEGGSLTAIAGFDGHQGVALVVEPRQFATLDDILARADERGEPPFILVLDSLEDPQNFGTLLRSAEAAGVHGIVFPTRRQAPLSAAAVKASAGAVEHLLLSPVDDLSAALADLHARGLRIAGSEADAPLTARQTDLRGPLAIVVGSEGQGLGPSVRRRCDVMMRIPMRGSIGSLNAAVAGSVLLFEAVTQRYPDGRPVATATAPTPLSETPSEPEPASLPDADDAASTADLTPDTGPDATPARGPDEDDLLPGGPPAETAAEPPQDAEPARPARKPRTARTPRA